MSRKRGGTSPAYSFAVEVGAVRIESTGLRPTRRLLLDLMGEAAGVTLALLSSDDVAGSSAPVDDAAGGDQPPFGFAPLAASTDLAEPHRDDRFDWVWDEEEDTA